jgi:hypothetical protein
LAVNRTRVRLVDVDDVTSLVDGGPVLPHIG